MSALGSDPARHEDVVLRVGADLAHVLSNVPSAEARVRVELFEPVRRGSARPLDPDRPTAPVREHPRSLGMPRPAGLPAPDEPLNVGVRVLGAEPAGLGEHLPPTVGAVDHHATSPGRSTCRAQALASTAGRVLGRGGAIRNRPSDRPGRGGPGTGVVA